MTKRNIFAVGLVVFGVTLLAFSTKAALSTENQPAQSVTVNPTQSQANAIPGQDDAETPLHIIYGVLFRELQAFQKKAEEKEAKGEVGIHLRLYHQQQLQLDAQPLEALRTIAAQYQQDIAAIDQEAKRIINIARARYPHGAMQASDTPPTPPAELTSLENQRTELLMKAREQVKDAFGEVAFSRFEEAAKRDFANKMRPVSLTPIAR